MKPLGKKSRNQLEKTVREARDIAENASKIALEQLGVRETTPFTHLSELERELRRKLRVHGRQLGDSLNGGKVQTMDRLIEEVAYEHWHRMLFARFLSENNLLMYPDPANPVPVTLEECEDLAAKEGVKDGWELASRFAARMLPQIFRAESPIFDVVLPPEHQQKLERLIDELPTDVFAASDSLGWVYQFWQAKKKDEVNASEIKIGAYELPAVTQLFTEPYMVNFLLDNSLGAWWASLRLTENDYATAKNEQELREKASIPGVPLEYLRFVKDEEGVWKPAAGTYSGWPERLGKLKILDPCCGSGHFLVAIFRMLVAIRMESEGISAKDAVDAVLLDNLHGLEIDQRCVELAAFALAFEAWRYPGATGYRQLCELNIACSGLKIGVKKEEWLALARNNANLHYALEELNEQFKYAPVLGSLINPLISLGKGTLVEIKWDKVRPLLTKILSGETDYEKSEIGVVAQGLAKAEELLSQEYDWVITNVPYLAWGKQNEEMQNFTSKRYSYARKDLANVFLERIKEFCSADGTMQLVMPQNWLFLTSYKAQRELLLKDYSILMLVQLGAGAFDSISGEVVKAILITIVNKKTAENIIHSIDVSKDLGTTNKRENLKAKQILRTDQHSLINTPDSRIALSGEVSEALLSKFAFSAQGIGTTDNPRFVQLFWEQPCFSKEWEPFQTACASQNRFLVSGFSSMFRWGGPGSDYFKHIEDLKKVNRIGGGWQAGSIAWGLKGLSINVTGKKNVALYSKGKFDTTTAAIIAKDPVHLPAILSFVLSPDYESLINNIDPTLSVTEGTLVKVPFDLNWWTEVAKEKYPDGLPLPYSEDPTQWVFHGNPSISDAPLQVAVVRMLGYRWPAELTGTMELSNEANALAKMSKNFRSYADEDGIVCIPSIRGELKAEERLEKLLAAAYGTEWSSSKRSELLTQVNYTGKTLESWLREDFFIRHCKLFHDRPFIWHIWDGLSDGFAVLVNYHKLDAKLLETLIYTYLGDWISRQKQEKAQGKDGAEEKLAAAENLKKRLELILEGEKPYDIFVRWKAMERQPIGWDPDLNDGVRLNIRPFTSVPDIGKKGAGVLRDKPNINWGKDRGKDVESAPWFKLGPKYVGHEGDRINDHHLSLAEKHAARRNSVQSNLEGN